MLASGPGCSPFNRADSVRMRISSSTVCSTYTRARRWRSTGSVTGPAALAASTRSSAVGPLPHSTPPLDSEMRSLPSVTLARRHPSLRSPTRLAAGSRASVKKTSLNVWPPVISVIGRISIPGASIGQMK